jgi:protein-S-isoprenylcysteine O-methyltransferase Ste14
MQAEGADVLRLVLLWSGWCVLHSLLITAKLNAWVTRRGGAIAGSARLVYNLISVVTLAPVLWYQVSLPARTLFAWEGPWRALQAVLLAYAVLMFVAGKRSYDMGHFLGTRQWRAHRTGRPPAALPFRTTGALRWVRHPWYSGGLAVVCALGPVTDVNLGPRIILALYFVVGSLLEERKLLADIGPTYAEYRRRVPMLLPWKGPAG